MALVDGFLDNVDAVLSWFSTSIKQTAASYCDLESADNKTTLVTRDGSLVSILKIEGVTQLVGKEEFERIHDGLLQNLQTNMSRPGHSFQVIYEYDRSGVKEEIDAVYDPAKETSMRLNLELEDLFNERRDFIAQYCASEAVYLVLWTKPVMLTKEQMSKSTKDKLAFIKKGKIPPMRNMQNFIAAIPELRNTHDAFIRSLVNSFPDFNMVVRVLDVHAAVKCVRRMSDSEFTSKDWQPILPGDRIPVREDRLAKGDLSGVFWPVLSKQILPRDGEILNLKTVRVGDTIYSPMYIELFPQEIKPFITLFSRVLPTRIPWRVSFLVDSDGLNTVGLKSTIASILSFASSQNPLIADAIDSLRYLSINTDDAVVRLRVSFVTWAPAEDITLLRTRSSELVKAIEGWGTCEVSQVSGDAYAGYIASLPAVNMSSVATASLAPLSDVVSLLPITRPASVWKTGAMLFRSPDGKLWPFQPGSSQQTTWIDLVYARPGSGKSVLSNALNLALCLQPGVRRLPRISIVDIGPSSSGLISLLKESLPKKQRHLVAYHRLRMTKAYAINPFDTQLGCRFPIAQERSFLVNFVTLLSTPLGAEKPYDGMPDMAGLIVDELYMALADDAQPRVYTSGIIDDVDALLEDIGFVADSHTTWWEVTDALFLAGFSHEAMMAQRMATPLLADATSICRTKAVEDLYGQVVAPTGEPLIKAFTRMISSAVREYPVLSTVTQFDLGEARVVSLDLDEVAKTGGDASDRQTAVMYMLARYILAKDFYLTEDSVSDMPENYLSYHKERITEIREDPKRIVFDEFHRTSKASAVRDQVIVDMREGRKWNVQIALLSQSIEDFDPIMVEFATSTYIMDAGPEQALQRATEVFGLSPTARTALKTRVHGPREGGSTFLAQFATKNGLNTQLLTSTIGPIELWAFSTTAEDANLRNKLYKRIGPKEARRVLANLFPTGSIKAMVEDRMSQLKADPTVIEEVSDESIVDQILGEILDAYSKNPDLKRLPAKK
jgi:intracellular multiplication protein IcmB